MVWDKSFWRPANLIVTWFGVGLLPKIPGTWGSLAALPLAWLIVINYGQTWLCLAALILFIIGTFASEHYLQNKTDSDPPQIVVDEVVGQWLTLTIVPPDLLYYMTAFFLFRVADILKPWPANKVDCKMKNGFGVMLDDVVAAIYAASVLFVIKVIIVG